MCIFYKIIITKLNILVTKYPLPCVIPGDLWKFRVWEREKFLFLYFGAKDSFEYPELGKLGNFISATL